MSLFGGGGLFGNKPATTQAGGLFGQQPAAPATGGLFGNTTTPAATGAGAGGLFGSTITTQPQTGGGLFGSTTTTTQAQIGGGLFGSTTTQPQQAGGLFGGETAAAKPAGGLFGETATTQPAAGGLFGSTTTQPQQGGGLFGATPAQAPPAGQSLFGATGQFQPQNGTSQPEKLTNYFDSILEKSRKRALGEGDTGEEGLPQLQLGLGDLRQRIKRLNSGTRDRGADGRAHYLLAASGVDPGAAVRDLNAFSAATGRADRPQYQEPADTDVEGYLLNLQTQTTLSMISDGLARSVRDFDNFLEENVNMEWDAQRKRIYEHFGIKRKSDDNSSTLGAPQKSQGGFGRSRRSKAAGLANSQTLGQSTLKSTFGRSGLQKSVIGAAAPVGTSFQPSFSDVEKMMEANNISLPDSHDRSHREKQSRYADKVAELNQARLQKHCYPVLKEFGDVASQGPTEEHTQYLSQIYGALIEITKEEPRTVSQADPLAIPERKFAVHYLDETKNSERTHEINRRILRGSTRYLESLFYQELQDYISKSAKDARLGGLPGVIKKVQAYVRLKDSRRDLIPDEGTMQNIGDDRVWAVVFYLVRSGHAQEALDYVEQNRSAFDRIDANFPIYLTNYLTASDNRLQPRLQDSINKEYHQRLYVAPPGSIDPFKMALYKIIGRCDLRNRSLDGIVPTMEDYFWLQFVLAREARAGTEMANEVCNLNTVKGVTREVGARFFSKRENYGAYAFLQILSGNFEDVVAYLYPYSYTDAVHLGIALDYYGLLRVSDPALGDSNLLSHTTTELPQIQFGQMLGLYTRDFRAGNVTAAVDYLALICLNKDLPGGLGKHQVALCHEALREIVLESREFAKLIGDIRSDGQRIPGIIEKTMKLISLDEMQTFMRTITIQAASVADDNGRTTDAVLLYHLAGEYDNVITIVNRALSEALAIQIGQDPMRLTPLKPRVAAQDQQNEVSSLSLSSVDDPLTLARNMSGVYKQNKMYLQSISDSNMADCEVLIKISAARDLVQHEQWSLALDVSYHPLSPADKMANITTGSRDLPDSTHRCQRKRR